MTTRAASHPPLPDAPRVAAFMPARDAASTIGAAVASLRRQPEIAEIVVAVPAADRATRDALQTLPGDGATIRVVDNPTGLIPQGLNRAWRAADADVLVRLDAHSVLPDGYVARALDLLRQTGAGNVGGVQRPVAAEGFAAAVALAMASVAGSGGATYRTGREPGLADTVFLGVFRKDALEGVGGYDERFERNEDAELNLRLRAANWPVWFSPDLGVDYRPRGTVRALARQYHANGRWRRLTASHHPGSVGVRQVAPAALSAGVLLAPVAALLTRRWLPLLVPATYALGTLVEGVRIAASARQGRQVAVALATMHLSFGVGYLQGPPRRGRSASQ